MANLQHHTEFSGKCFHIAHATQLEGTSIPLNFFQHKIVADQDNFKDAVEPLVQLPVASRMGCLIPDIY